MPNWTDDEEFSHYDDDDDYIRDLATTSRYAPARLKQPENKKKIWNGQLISEMDTDHIINSILYCERKFINARDNYQRLYPGEVFYFNSIEEMYPSYKFLREELKLRDKHNED